MRKSHTITTKSTSTALRILVVAGILPQLLSMAAAQADTNNMELKQVHVITRHGSRRPLPKTAVTLQEDDSENSLLTPIGQQQHYELGKWLRERYLPASSQLLDQYDPLQVHMESSSYQRTMVSANSLALGLFPKESRGVSLLKNSTITPAVIPIYTKDRTNDYLLRAHDKCPTYHDTLEQLYQAQMWHRMELDSMPLLKKLAQMPAFADYVQQYNGDDSGGSYQYIPLGDLWNVYDAIEVVRTECGTPDNNNNNVASQVCQELPDPNLATAIQGEDWKDIQELAHAVELLKFGSDIAENKVGGPLLNTILTRMESNSDESHFYVSSAHYPTLLGLYAAFQIPFHEEKVIPEYASALILELYQTENNSNAQQHNQFVKIIYKSGSNTGAQPIKLSSTCQTDVEQGCTLEQFAHEMNGDRLTAEDWCQKCGNTQADVCLQTEVTALQDSCSSSGSSNNNNNALFAAIYFGGVISTVILIMFWKTLCSKRRCPEANNNHKVANDLTMDLATVKPPSMDEIPNDDVEHKPSKGASGVESAYFA